MPLERVGVAERLYRTFYTAMTGLWVPIPIIAAALVTVFSLHQSFASTVPFFILCWAIGSTLLLAFRRDRRLHYLRLFTTIYSLQAIAAVVFTYVFLKTNGVPFFGVRYYGQIGVDGYEYNLWGSLASQLPFWDYQGLSSITFSRYYGYIYILGWVHRFSSLFGDYSYLNPRILNALGSGLISVLITHIAVTKFSFSERLSLATGYLVGIYPATVAMAVQIHRDVLITVLILLNVMVFERLRREGVDPLLLLVQALLLTALLEFRFESLIPLVGALAVALLVVSSSRVGLVRRVLVLVALAMSVVAITLLSDAIRPLDLLVERATEGYLTYILERNVSSERSVAQLLLTLPFPFAHLARLAYNLILPVPILHVGRPYANFVALSAMIWYPLIPFSVVGLVRGLRDPGKATYAIVAAVYFVGVALTTLSIRHTLQYMPLFLLFGVDGLRRHRWTFKLALVTGVYLLAWAVLAYVYYKSG